MPTNTNIRRWFIFVALALAAFVVGAAGATAIVPLAADAHQPAADTQAVPLSEMPSRSAAATAVGEEPPGAVQCLSEPTLCERGEEIADSLAYPWRSLGYDVRIAPPPDDWHAGVSRHDVEVIELYVRPESTRDGLERTLAHEIAHALHTVCPDRLEAWRERRGLGADVPLHVPAPHDYDSVAEDFAEAFSQYLGHGTSRSTVGAPVTDEWLRANDDLFASCVEG
ncbi:MAG: hypothetical protein R3320_07670 [Nitriliruptorales bacterium]|nr:hypothetical protein [Nitriliruptorales bacterium]